MTDTNTTNGAADLRDTLINIAREIEALKRECGMDPESPIAIQNGRYMALSYKVRALAAGQATAAQQGVAYAALPEPITYQIAVLKACEHGDALVGWRVEPSRQSFDASMRPKRKLYTEGDMHDFADRTHALRASHGQAPAQAAPAAVAGPSISQVTEQMRAAGDHAWMTSDGVDSARVFWAMLAAAPTAQPAPQQEAPAMPSGWVSCTIEFDGSGPEEVAYGPKIMMDRLAKWLGKHFERTIAEKAAPQPSPAAQGDALDVVLDAFENKTRGIPQAHIAAALVADMRAAHKGDAP